MLVADYAAISHRQDAISGAYISAVCATAGCGLEAVRMDNDKVDYLVRARVQGKALNKPQIDIQAKCQRSGPASGDPISFPLDLETYDNLRDPKVCIPRILVVVFVPNDVQEWLAQTEHALTLRHCAYWMSLKGLQSSSNAKSQTVYIPRKNLFGPQVLQSMMTKIADGLDLQ
ncbi:MULTISPECIES: DUF4365 domain-containing protein [unclassified Bradyrhizobium]|uniref:DUF4365 domain-containing protein n=1 Tax=unclassified Bradyrhizobium TaxID=2631580 RepID=UPI001FF760F2|nr:MULTISPECIES: DUF4365 domain-containing protein [unclassified Bradyrhizobium]MCK1712020.1 DUF4365 domain-containing protein [Bradyrhizobium sp. 143]MCK1725469.1 DUF4365 domain-containing protein [Bradyrhizobium sp. 142]